MQEQLVFPVRLNDQQSLENYFPGPNAGMFRNIKDLLDKDSGWQQFYLWGNSGTGKTHLLQALCHAWRESGGNYLYLPLRQFSLSPELSRDAGQYELICLDDLQGINNVEAEKLLFLLLEMSKQRSARLVFSANCSPATLHCKMPELQTRLNHMLVYRLKDLSDLQQKLALQWRARRRGFELSDDVLHYIQTWFARDTASLFSLLDQIDKNSLIDKRRITVPYLQRLQKKIDDL